MWQVYDQCYSIASTILSGIQITKVKDINYQRLSATFVVSICYTVISLTHKPWNWRSKFSLPLNRFKTLIGVYDNLFVYHCVPVYRFSLQTSMPFHYVL